MDKDYLLSRLSDVDYHLESEEGYDFFRAGIASVEEATTFAFHVYRDYYGPCIGWTATEADLAFMISGETEYATKSFQALARTKTGKLIGSMRVTAWQENFVFPPERIYGITIRSRAYAKGTAVSEWGHSSQIAVDEKELVRNGFPATTTSRKVFRGLVRHCAIAAYLNGIDYLICEFDKPMEWVFRRLGVTVRPVTEEIDPDFLGGSRVCEVELGPCWGKPQVRKLLEPYYGGRVPAGKA